MGWVLPHEEEMPPELVNPRGAEPRWVLPHEEPAEPTAYEQILSEMPASERVLIGAKKKVRDLGLGFAQRTGELGNLVGVKNQLPQAVSRKMREERELRGALSRDPYASKGEMGAGLAIGMLPGTRPLRAAAFGALEGAATPMENPTFSDVALEAGKNAALYGVGTKLGNTLITTGAKGKNAFRGKFRDPVEERRFRIFKENEVPASLGDITQNPTIMRFENAARRIPGSGRTAFMENQARRLGEVIEAAPEKISGGVPSGTKEDLGATVYKSIKDKYAQVKANAKTLYDDVSNRVQAVGAPPVPVTGLAAETNALLSKYPSAFAKLSDDPATVDTLVQIAQGTHPTASRILGPNGQPIMKPAQLSFDDLRQLDSDLGAIIRQGRILSSSGKYNNKTFGQLVKVQQALRKDIEDWATSIGDEGISRGVADANKYFKENVVPFRKNPLVRKVIQDDLQPEQIDSLTKSMFQLDSPGKATSAKMFMTPEGIQAGRYYLLKEAENRAMNEALESGYSPSQFLRKSNLGETGPKLFSADELGQLDDLQELIRSSRRAAGYSADPETGASLATLAPFLSMKIPLVARGYSSAVQSEAPMRFLLSDPRLYTGQSALGRTAENMLRRGTASAIENAPEYLTLPEEPTAAQ